jgi:hypothetical protein
VIALFVGWLSRRAEVPVSTCLQFTIGNNLVSVLWVIPSALGRAGILQLAADVLLLVGFALLLARIWKDTRIPLRSTDGDGGAGQR